MDVVEVEGKQREGSTLFLVWPNDPTRSRNKFQDGRRLRCKYKASAGGCKGADHEELEALKLRAALKRSDTATLLDRVKTIYDAFNPEFSRE